ncbi:GAF and ANTAR domain-containing protein [Streptosporangium sp. DT93]|uniref:GAF and ANTAR domain-containing protein n=1 Tax=Streptosporangium sp. DT93 TaxID=3393428 RepID=UPI003CF4AFFE
MPSPFTATTSDPTWPDPLLSLLLSTRTFETFLHELAVLTAEALPQDSMCGITVTRPPHAATIAGSDDLTLAVDRIQYRTGQGPCLDTLADGGVHRIADTSVESRWPAFCAEAFAHGVRSCLSIPMLLVLPEPAGVRSCYNLYNPRPGVFDEAVQARMHVLAANAAGSVSLALRIAGQARSSEDLRATLASRSVIDQAIGIVMKQGCPPGEAFALLSRASQNRNLKIRVLAAEIVATAGGRAPGPGTTGPSE